MPSSKRAFSSTISSPSFRSLTSADEPFVAQPGGVVLGLLRLQLGLEFALVRQAALAEPEFGVHEREQGDQREGEEAHLK